MFLKSEHGLVNILRSNGLGRHRATGIGGDSSNIKNSQRSSKLTTEDKLGEAPALGHLRWRQGIKTVRPR